MPTEILKKVAEIIKQRASTHGDYQENFKQIADLWAAFLKVPITPAQVCAMMVLLKFSRDQCGSHDPDHWLDVIGYATIASAISTGGNQQGG